jgi:CHAD domain-containing protein
MRMADALLDSDLARLRKTLRLLVARGGTNRAEALQRISEMAREAGTEIQAGFATTGDRFDATTLHVIRRRCRRLRYAAEIACALRGEASEVPGLFKSLQEMLGALHDRHVLGMWLAARGLSARRGGHIELAAAAEAEARWAKGQAREQHREVLEKKPQALAARALAALARLAAARSSPAKPARLRSRATGTGRRPGRAAANATRGRPQ